MVTAEGVVVEVVVEVAVVVAVVAVVRAEGAAGTAVAATAVVADRNRCGTRRCTIRRRQDQCSCLDVFRDFSHDPCRFRSNTHLRTERQ